MCKLRSGRAKRETAKGRNRTRNAHFRRFLLIFADFRLALQIKGFGSRRFVQKTAGNRRFSQETAENRRFLQKPVSPICCLPFGALLIVFGISHRGRRNVFFFVVFSFPFPIFSVFHRFLPFLSVSIFFLFSVSFGFRFSTRDTVVATY